MESSKNVQQDSDRRIIRADLITHFLSLGIILGAEHVQTRSSCI